ncbi:FkbM family methyltransferase [Pseudomonas sp. PDM16]|uniref:FkbM family methyltransferase n=1 Tax=Pseudomonas sp. PDM16 TaxID=2769292 RepID=UPI001784BBEF|nr:FkbM family methyltransferase [Pseudomonas sp. PDM16]MBD9414004.1 FkbM family methyltransferase [Pseudomonas sp. PDM16]
MISYAQNFEDVILERIFKNQKDGFYIDVGACHPMYDSVTQHFYLKGWSGINIEPQPDLHAQLQAVRDRDINLQVCVGAKAGNSVLSVTVEIGTSTLRKSIADSYRSEGKVSQELVVEVVTLDSIWEEYVGERQVDFLKIDVEGFEKEVLSGADFSKVAPSILVVEATSPNSPLPIYGQWEHLLLDCYEFFYFDGLNRFYARKSFSFDSAACAVPPNVFDNIKTYPSILLEQESRNQKLENDDLNKQLKEALDLIVGKDAALVDAGAAYEALQGEAVLQRQQLEEAAAVGSDYRGEIAKIQNAYDALMIAMEKKEQDLLDALDLIYEKDVGLTELASSYETVQNQLQAKEEELQQTQWMLKGKDIALQDAAAAYEALQIELQRVRERAELLGESLRTAMERGRDAADAYKSLRDQFDLKLAELEATQGALALKEAQLLQSAPACEGAGCAPQVPSGDAYSALLLDELQMKDDALLDAARSYASLRDEFDRKLRELEVLHERLAASPGTEGR